MSSHTHKRRTTVADIRARKGGDPLVCLTAYTASMAEILDPHVDLLLVGDSLGNVLLGHNATIPVSLDDMIHHAKAVARAKPHSLLGVDLPFGSYEASPQQAYETSVRVMKETDADAVKLEGGLTMAPTIAFLTERGVPVIGHIGLRPQAVRTVGGYKVVGRTSQERKAVLEDAAAVADAGAFCVVVEGVVEPVAAEITSAIDIPTIGIGASAACDGQILVTEDLLGLFERSPRFVREFANLRAVISDAVAAYADAVKERNFPSDTETYKADPEQF
ncbi:MAG: 3-methyl-2-oxobutanoate hydroxymethyltransferase [Pseudomonadota bacterium]